MKWLYKELIELLKTIPGEESKQLIEDIKNKYPYLKISRKKNDSKTINKKTKNIQPR
jgi:ketol-acid reductoisomerase